MSDMEKIERAFLNQSKIKGTSFDKLSFEVFRSVRGDFKLTVSTLQIGFIFTARGKLRGMINWKQ